MYTAVQCWCHGASFFLAFFFVRKPHSGNPVQGQLSWDLSGMNQMFPEGALTRLHALFFQVRKKELILIQKLTIWFSKKESRICGICGGHSRNWPLVTVLITFHVLAWLKEDLRKKGFLLAHSLRVQCILEGEVVASGALGRCSHCIYSQETQQDKRWCSCYVLPFVCSRPQCIGWSHPLLVWVFPPQLIQFRNFLTAMARGHGQ